jgi:CheY-like chemotaxis protein
VKGLVVLHGGTVEAASDGLGRGSTFTIRIPGSAVREASIEQTAEVPVMIADGPAGRILVVDDNRDAAGSLAMVLNSSGHSVRTANSGEQALQIGAAESPDAVVLDIGMPGMNGYEVARRIRQEPWGRSVFLVALTGWGQKEDIERAITAGFDFHMTKPADPERIEQVLGQFLKSRATGAAVQES